MPALVQAAELPDASIETAAALEQAEVLAAELAEDQAASEEAAAAVPPAAEEAG
jgi:hypothetical protein